MVSELGGGYRRPPKHTQFKKGTSGNPAVDEDAIGVDSHFDSDQGIMLLPQRGGDDRFGDGIGQSVGMSWRNVFGMMVHGLGSWMISLAHG